MRQLIRISVLACVPLLILGFPGSSSADSTIPLTQVLEALEPQTQIPLLVPATIPQMDQVYVSTDGSADSYSVNFDYISDCAGATPCTFGGIWGLRNGSFYDPAEMGSGETIEPVTLANNTPGQVAETCGAYCTMTVLWQSDGVLYGVSIKNGLKEDAMGLANDAILAGPRGR